MIRTAAAGTVASLRAARRRMKCVPLVHSRIGRPFSMRQQGSPTIAGQTKHGTLTTHVSVRIHKPGAAGCATNATDPMT